MHHFSVVSVLFIVVNYLCIHNVWAQSSTTVRPYEFGFTIDEQQHRYEKRDERGIVMGEFGFITADGIYHVTVYATDEEGKFRILAMKNYPYESPPKTVEMIIQPKKTPTIKTTTTTTLRPIIHKFNYGTDACGGCLLPDRSYDDETNDEELSFKPSIDFKVASQETLKPPLNGDNTIQSDPAAKSSSIPTNKVVKKPPLMDIIIGKVLPAIMTPSTEGALAIGRKTAKEETHVNKGTSSIQSSAGRMSTNFPELATGKPENGESFGLPGFSVNDARNDLSSISSSESSLSPPSSPLSSPSSTSFPRSNVGSDVGDGDLYRFKYLLDYHGHAETGSYNGNKVGNYFVINDDDIKRTIEYIADENGFQPHVHWRKLDMSEINAKSKENSLQDYEFVWFRS